MAPRNPIPPHRRELAAAIARSGIEQQQIAAVIERKPDTVSAILRGRRNPSPETASAIAAVLDVDVSSIFPELFDGDEVDDGDVADLDPADPWDAVALQLIAADRQDVQERTTAADAYS